MTRLRLAGTMTATTDAGDPRDGGWVCVTGGAGFIGQHLVATLLDEGVRVVVIDDFSSSDRRSLMRYDGRDDVRFIEGDVGDIDVMRYALEGCGAVFHLAANPEVRIGESEPLTHKRANVDATAAVLEAMRLEGVPDILFTSTSTIYGEATEIPTPESYGPLLPISIYGGAKLACEALISAYCGTFDLRAALFRFANVVGPGATHGVTVDFVAKLRQDPARMEILGDGKQTKSYVHVQDTVQGMLHAWRHGMPESGHASAYNIGSIDWIPVTEVADIVAEVLGAAPEYSFMGGTRGGGGWKGDVPRMMLATDALRALGWEANHSSAEAIRDTASWLVGETAPGIDS